VKGADLHQVLRYVIPTNVQLLCRRHDAAK
jgi:hypothetical protein